MARHKSLAEERPDLLNEWNEKNNELGIFPDKVSACSSKKVWWVCWKGHEWKVSIANRSNGSNCPVCSHHKVLSGYNDLKTTRPDLLKEWDYEKNDELGIFPDKVFACSSKKVWWKCKNGHRWSSCISNRVGYGRNCPVCSNQKVVSGYNDLATTNPEILQEWNYDKNNELGIYPDKVTVGSSKKVWWKCSTGHEWKSSIASRSNGSNCPVCSHHKVLSGYNDLKTTRPDLLKEWDYEKNNELGIFPDKVSYGSSKKVWWKCHVCACEWETSVSNRTRKNGRGCPRCNSRYGTSFPEQAVFYFLKMLWNVNIYNRYKINNQMEVDVYCPDKKIGIEYDGTYWHQNKREKDINKEKQLKKIGIKLFRIIESNENRVDGNKIYYNSRERYNYDNLSWAISRLLDMFGVGSLFVDVDAYQIEIQEQYKTNVLKNSLANVNPELAKQWHPTKNGTLTSYNFLPNSNDKVWWLCPKCGYEWKTFISHRNKSHGCPACAGQVIWKGNDFETLYPDIAKQWHPTLNGGRKPSEFRPCSGKTVFWLCPNCNHVWRTSIQQRVKFHTGCPKCYKINRKKKK